MLPGIHKPVLENLKYNVGPDAFCIGMILLIGKVYR